MKILREQLQAAEKILHANEQSMDELKSQKRALDSRITKLQNMKKVQQQILQKILVIQPNTIASKLNESPSSVPSAAKVDVSAPPLPTLLPPPPPSLPLQAPPPLQPLKHASNEQEANAIKKTIK